MKNVAFTAMRGDLTCRFPRMGIDGFGVGNDLIGLFVKGGLKGEVEDLW